MDQNGMGAATNRKNREMRKRTLPRRRKGLPCAANVVAKAEPRVVGGCSSLLTKATQIVKDDSHLIQISTPEKCRNGDVTNGNEYKTDDLVSSSTREDHDASNKDDEKCLNSAVPQTASSTLAATPNSVRSSSRKRKPRAIEFAVTTEQSSPPKKKLATEKVAANDDTENEFETTWICSECKEAECCMIQSPAEGGNGIEDEDHDSSVLMICEGVCRRLFHYPCVGLAALPEGEYICPDCTNNRHACAICQLYGNDNEDVFRCKRDKCGLFYHESCLAMQNVDMQIVSKTELNTNSNNNYAETESAGTDSNQGHTLQNLANDNVDSSETEYRSSERRFVCPAHACWTCAQEQPDEAAPDDSCNEQTVDEKIANKKRKKTKRTKKGVFVSKSGVLVRCLECPTSFHVTCIPPSARFHELALLCHEHASTCKLPQLDPENSLQHKIENEIDKRMDVVQDRLQRARKKKNSKNKFVPGLVGDKLTAAETSLIDELRRTDATLQELWFCLPCDIKNEVYSKPPSYHHVHTLQYDPSNRNRPPFVTTASGVCQCVGHCGSDCINRMLYVECFGNPVKSGQNSKFINCQVGPGCGNRSLGQRKCAKLKPEREQGKGWGCIAVEKIPKGALVHEYVGEVIDEKTKESRLLEWTRDHPNDPNFYIMALQPGWFIDARFKANLSRFINHSCDPNCVLLPINVGGNMRNGIFATRDILPGEYLSYDYRFDTRHGDQFVCRCGVNGCRGTMKGGGGALELAAKKKSKLDLWKEAKAKFERDKKFLNEWFEEELKRRSQVDAIVPGAERKDELVANGPQMRYRETVIRHRSFLWRNAVQGDNFCSRNARIESRRNEL